MNKSFKNRKVNLAGLLALSMAILMLLAACGGTSSSPQANATATAFVPLPTPKPTTAPGTAIPLPGTPTAIPTGPTFIPTAGATSTPTSYEATYKGSLKNTTIPSNPSSDLTLNVTAYPIFEVVNGSYSIGTGYYGSGKTGSGSFNGFLTTDGTIYLLLKPIDPNQGPFLLNAIISATSLTGNGSFQESQGKTGTWTVSQSPGSPTATGSISSNDGASGDLILSNLKGQPVKETYGIKGDATFSDLLGGGPVIGTLSKSGMTFSVLGSDIQSLTQFIDPPSGSTYGGSYVINSPNINPTQQKGTWNLTQN
jgi:hypothetical protein